ncbi:hypothetical protein SEA_CREWMATE_42 [Arthrobacter phage Crewmate]|uniref:Uncharacterized protein n=1 Tax=Arthrobacter phage Crewmate TaxID=2832317 RepID=A0AA49B373_9CAUD|nr:hypothetical protein PQE17_gp42 [Arthrobacter phage Crewmate]UIW13294.1 hypothetical protein SEA_CREWMATE_42 [Arthrobacter phage Crewmate]
MHEAAPLGRPVDDERPAEEREGTYILLPVLGEPDVWVAVFSDGSYSRWIPSASAR